MADKHVNAFVFRDHPSLGVSIDVTFYDATAIRRIIRDIEEHAASTELAELAAELREGLGKIENR